VKRPEEKLAFNLIKEERGRSPRLWNTGSSAFADDDVGT
jgi:hypothetical protein